MHVDRRYLVAVALVCLAVRLAFFAAVQPWDARVLDHVVLRDDSGTYHQLAITLVTRHRFASSSAGPAEALRTPLYPLFVGAVYAVFGYAPWMALVAQIVVDTLSCLVLLAALSRLCGSRIALVAALLYALDPFLLQQASAWLATETLFVFCLVVAYYCIARALTAQTARRALLTYGLASIALGLATLVRPVSQYILAVLLLFFALWYRRRPRFAVACAATCLVAFALTLAPWLIRNDLIFGRAALSTSGPYNLLVLDVVPLEMAHRHQDAQTVKAALLGEADEMILADGRQPRDVNDFQRADYWQRLALRHIAADPLLFGQIYARGTLDMFVSLGTSMVTQVLGLPTTNVDMRAYTSPSALIRAFLSGKGAAGFLIAGVIAAYLLVSYLGLAAGLFVSWPRYNRGLLLFSLLMVAYFVAVSGPAGLSRFRLPAVPFYLVFSAVGISHLYDWARGRRRAPVPDAQPEVLAQFGD